MSSRGSWQRRPVSRVTLRHTPEINIHLTIQESFETRRFHAILTGRGREGRRCGHSLPLPCIFRWDLRVSRVVGHARTLYIVAMVRLHAALARGAHRPVCPAPCGVALASRVSRLYARLEDRGATRHPRRDSRLCDMTCGAARLFVSTRAESRSSSRGRTLDTRAERAKPRPSAALCGLRLAGIR